MGIICWKGGGLKLYSINQASSEGEIDSNRALAASKVEKGTRIVTGEMTPRNSMRRTLSMCTRIVFSCIALVAVSGLLPWQASATGHVAEIIAKASSLGKKEKEAFLVEGAKREGEITIYGSSDVSHFNESMRVFNLRYPFIKSSYLRASRARLVSTVMLEWRSNRNAVDIINSVLYQGFELLAPKGLIQPYLSPERANYNPIFYAKDGSWYTYHTLVGALVYNKNLVKPNEVPKTYDDLLQPKWKGKLIFDTLSDYLLASFEHAWGKEKAVEYMKKLATQQLVFHGNRVLEVNLVAAGEFPIAIDVHADSAAEVREKGAPIGITLLRPYLVKPHGLFLPRNAPHPFAALLYHDWLLSAEGQTVWGRNIGRTIARKDVPVRHPEFRVDPDFALIPETYANRVAREKYTREFRDIFGLAK